MRPGSAPARRIASKGSQRISINGDLGLAASRADLLDALGPAVPELLSSREASGGVPCRDVGHFYLALRKSGAVSQLQFFPRLESLRTWTCLRRDGLCGLTPDEALVLRLVLGSATEASTVRCVTSLPRQTSTVLQIGTRIYYESKLPVPELLSSLRTIDSGGADSAAYLPREPVFALLRTSLNIHVSAGELGEWCLA